MICFQNSLVSDSRVVTYFIIALTSYWCKSRLDNSYCKLFLIMPFDVSSLTQMGSLIVLSDSDTLDQDNSLLYFDVDPGLGLEG